MTIHQLGKKRAYCVSYRGMNFIFSYNTHIATLKNGTLYKHWEGYSVTSLRHLNEMLYLLGYMWRFTKAEWLEYDYTPIERLLKK